MRKVWFITRPERDPKFHRDALQALQIATNNFSVVWRKNRDVHRKYEYILNSHGLKRNNISHDGSGGRTWAAMLRTFGYVYLNNEGYLVLTKVGKAILNGHKVWENISKQILTLQIPNAYFLSSGFKPKFEDGFQIRPARFLIHLVNQQILNYYVTKEEITFFALTAKRDSDLFEVTQKILEFRNASEEKKEEMKREIAYKFDHRKRSDSVARDFEQAHGDVAHTFMMLCDYTGLVDYVRRDALRLPSEKRDHTTKVLNYFDSRYPFNKRYLISLERFSENAGLDIDSYKATPYGSLPPATNKRKSIMKVKKLLSSYPSIHELTIDEIINILQQEFSPNEAKKIASKLHEQTFEVLNEDFVESYLNENDNRKFEDKTGQILKALGFEVEMRPTPKADVLTEIEILMHVDQNTICIIDAKNYKDKFRLTSNLANHMAVEYIPNYDGYKGKTVAYFGYVTVNNFTGEGQLKQITKKANKYNPNINATGAIFTAKALLGFLDYCLDNNLNKVERKKKFISLFKNKGYETVTNMLINSK